MSLIRQSVYDAQVAKLRAKFPGKLGEEAVSAFSEGFEVVSDDHEAFRPHTPPAPKPAPAPRQESTVSRFDDLVQNAIMAGVDPAEARRRATIATGGEGSIEAKTVAELRADLEAMPKEAFGLRPTADDDEDLDKLSVAELRTRLEAMPKEAFGVKSSPNDEADAARKR